VRSPEKVCTVGSDCTDVGSDCNYGVGSDCYYSVGSDCSSDCTASDCYIQSEPTLYSLQWGFEKQSGLRLYILWAQTVTTVWAQTVTTAWAQTVTTAWAQTVTTAWAQTVTTAWAQTVTTTWAQTVQRGLRLLQSEPTLYSGLRWYGTNMKKCSRCGTKYHILPTEHNI